MIADNIAINSVVINNYPQMSFQGIGNFLFAAKSVIHYRFHRYENHNILERRSRRPKRSPNRLKRWVRKQIVRIHKEKPRWYASRVSRELFKRIGRCVSEKSCRKYMRDYDRKHPKKVKIRKKKKMRNKTYRKLQQVQLDVKGWFYIGKKKIYPIGAKDVCTRVAAVRFYHSMKSRDVIDLMEQFIREWGRPEVVKTDNHAIFKSEEFNNWCDKRGIKHKYIKKASPWLNAYIESFFRTVDREFLEYEFFKSLEHANRRLKAFEDDYNKERYHSSIKCTPGQKFKSC